MGIGESYVMDDELKRLHDELGRHRAMFDSVTCARPSGENSDQCATINSSS